MPLYELLCMAKPSLPREEMVRMIQRASEVILNKGGVLTNLTSYGRQHLAYDIRRPFQRFDQAHIWQLNFMVGREALQDLNHELKVNDNILRWVTVKRSKFDSFLKGPSTQQNVKLAALQQEQPQQQRQQTSGQ